MTKDNIMYQFHKSLIFVLLFFLTLPFAQSSEPELLTQDSKNIYLAQFEDSGDTYDPFTDYSEFENTAAEEADIYFFKHGRLLSIGGMLGMRMFTQTLGQHTRPALVGGGFFSFFFNMRIAIQLHYITGIHPFRSLEIESGDPNKERFINEMQLTQIGFDLKYYLNTQNVTQGLASFNPYFIAGGSSVRRRIKFRNNPAAFTDNKRLFGFHGGIGIEFPLTLNKVFFGIEAQYQYVKFPVLGRAGEDFNIDVQGHIIKGFGILGINF